jgi:hypothetical protein
MRTHPPKTRHHTPIARRSPLAVPCAFQTCPSPTSQTAGLTSCAGQGYCSPKKTFSGKTSTGTRASPDPVRWRPRIVQHGRFVHVRLLPGQACVEPALLICSLLSMFDIGCCKLPRRKPGMLRRSGKLLVLARRPDLDSVARSVSDRHFETQRLHINTPPSMVIGFFASTIPYKAAKGYVAAQESAAPSASLAQLGFQCDPFEQVPLSPAAHDPLRPARIRF